VDENTRQNSATVSPWLIAISVMLATFMEVLDTSIAAVALPYIAGSVGASNDEATWVLTSYLVSNAVILPTSAWFSLRFGRRNFLVASIFLFTVASFACGAAPSLPLLLLARTVQGLGGGALQPLSQAVLLETFPPEKRGLAMALFGLGVVVAPVLGPTLGGWLTDSYSWRWAFYINIPVGILAMFMISRYVADPPYVRDAKPGRLDTIGLGLLALWVGLLQVVLDKGQEDDWFGAIWIRWAVFVIVIAFVLFIVRELRHSAPVVDLRVLKDRNFTLGCLLIALFGAIIYAMVTILPLFYQTLLGYPAQVAGITVSPRGLGSIVAMVLVGYLSSRMDNRWLMIGGFALLGACNLLIGRLDLDIGPYSMLWPIVASGFAIGFVFPPLASTAMATVPNERIGKAAGVYNLLRNLGGSIGISMFSALLVRHEQLHRTELSSHLYGSSPAVDRMLSQFQELMASHAGAATPLKRAYGELEALLTRQAQLWSYVDDFRYLALLCFFCVPVVFLLKKVSSKGGATMVE
jgi:DHA2 family multidrug resistance protein